MNRNKQQSTLLNFRFGKDATTPVIHPLPVFGPEPRSGFCCDILDETYISDKERSLLH